MKFREYNQHQIWLIPPDIEALIPQKDICRTISTVIDLIDINAIENQYGEEGNLAYHPRMMLKIIFYAYFNGIYSGRKIAKELERNIYYWYLSGKQTPDFRTVCRFRDKHSNDMENIFAQIVKLCRKLGMIKLETVAIDDTKIRADASNDTFRNYVSSMIQQGIETDKKEDEIYGAEQKGDPDFLGNIQPNQEDIKKTYELMKVEERENIDTDCRLMKTSGTILPAYNAQVIVDEHCQIIISAGVIQDANDKYAIAERVNQVEAILNDRPQYLLADHGYWNVEHLKYLKDKGIEGLICDKEMKNIRKEINGDWDGFRGGKYSKDLFQYDVEKDSYICPEGEILTNKGLYNHGKYRNGTTVFKHTYSNGKACKKCENKHLCTNKDRGRSITRLGNEVLLDEAKAKIRSKSGYALYKKRMKIVEPVFGNIKWNKGLDRFTVRGKIKVQAQFLVACCIHNIEKMHSWQKECTNPLANYALFDNFRLFLDLIISTKRSKFNLFSIISLNLLTCNWLWDSLANKSTQNRLKGRSLNKPLMHWYI